MKISNIKCPNCGANINVDVSKQKTIFCTYCGQQLEVDNGVKEMTYTKNINKNVNVHNRYTNDADVIREENKNKKIKYDTIQILICFAIILLCGFGPSIKMKISKAINQSEGKISAGYYKDFEGENYQYVKSTLESAGFINIELIDLDDQGLFKKDGEVTSISVGGNTSFDSLDYFDKDVKVVITYH